MSALRVQHPGRDGAWQGIFGVQSGLVKDALRTISSLPVTTLVLTLKRQLSDNVLKKADLLSETS